MSAEIEEEDVNTLSFGADFDGAVFLPNSSIALLLQKIAEKKYGERAPPEVFAKAKTYASAFGGAVELTDVAAIDELYTSLRSLEFVRESLDAESGEPVVTKVKLHEYQLVALSNLNPSSIAAARCLIPSLDSFSDDELSECLTLLRRASAKHQPGVADTAYQGAAAAYSSGSAF